MIEEFTLGAEPTMRLYSGRGDEVEHVITAEHAVSFVA
jgi:hypothetical protein